MHRQTPASAGILSWTMPQSTHPSAIGHLPTGATAVAASLIAFFLTNCGKTSRDTSPPSPAADSVLQETSALLALALADLAKEALQKSRPEEALPLVVAALETDPACGEAHSMASNLLQSTRWFFPDASLKHGAMCIEGLQFGTDSTLWSAVSLGDLFDDTTGTNTPTHTVVKWNLETLSIDAVLFPASAHESSMLLDPTHRFAVIQRANNSDKETLLCDAQSLRPLRELGRLPASLNPSAVITFSADGLLMAHPTWASPTDRSIVWMVRDTGSGEIIRTSSPVPPAQAQPLTASLNRSRLRVLESNATLWEIPVSPSQAETRRSIQHPTVLLQAQFNDDGSSAEALSQYHGHNHPPTLITMDMDADAAPTRHGMELLQKFPWHMGPTIWSGLFREVPYRAILVKETRVSFPRQLPSYDINSSITAVATHGDRIAFGDINGGLNLFRILPTPAARPTKSSFPSSTSADTPSLAHLSEALTGRRYDRKSRKLVSLTPEQRHQALDGCNPDSLARIFPYLDFSPLLDTMRKYPHRNLPKDAAALLDQRLARFSEKPSFPDLEETFANADDEKIRTAIQQAAPSGARAAFCLALSIASTQPAWIRHCLDSFPHLPPLLSRIAHSRIAWLENRKADAISTWPDPIPDFDRIRRTEDWDGWEAADFRIAFEQIRQSIQEELAKLIVPENATQDQRDAVFSHLTDEATLTSLGRTRYARACLDAATRFSTFPSETERTFSLAQLARAMGAPPAQCLRAEALALTALNDHARARDRWLELITHQPVTDHQPGDYAEAAYSSFENGDPTQAMAILATGMHRYPNDSAFALRAGWIALLTTHPEPAYRFLLAGHRTGWPLDQAPHACALLAIAAFLSGAPDEAAAWFQQLVTMDASWRDEKHIANLTWPDELKSVLHHLAQHALLKPDH